MSAVEGLPAQLPSVEPAVRGQPASVLPTLCPFLTTPDGTWRAARAIGEHRCSAVSPPVPLALEKQRRLCLVDRHTRCATYRAALDARPGETVSGASQRPLRRSRPLARMSPVVLDQARFELQIPAFRADRASGQAVLVGVLGVALAIIILARPPGEPGTASPIGAATSSPPAGSPGTGTHIASAPPTGGPAGTSAPAPTIAALPSVTDQPSATPPPSGPSSDPAPSARPSTSASPAPALSGATYTVKRGDNLYAIAARFATTTQVLIKLNGIADPRKLKIGQILVLP